MVEFANSFQFKSVTCYQAKDDSLHYYYIPAAPEPETTANGEPTLRLIRAGDGAFLQLGAKLDAAPEIIEGLRHELANRRKLTDAALIQLSMAPITVHAVRLMIADANGKLVEAGHNDSSGFPPYTAIFSLQLTPVQSASIAAALNGRPNSAQIQYDLTLTAPVTVKAQIIGDLRPILADLPANAAVVDDNARLGALVDEAIANGKIQVESAVDTGAPPELFQSIMREAKAQIVKLVVQAQRGEEIQPDTTKASVTITLTVDRNVAFNPITDLATWFPSHTGVDHILVS